MKGRRYTSSARGNWQRIETPAPDKGYGGKWVYRIEGWDIEVEGVEPGVWVTRWSSHDEKHRNETAATDKARAFSIGESVLKGLRGEK